ncbi:MAG: hypothetical protein JO142_15175 [Burkholderiales bacterium]|nr:hypothetical protein [Burkholderiales bacterium]
MTIALLTIAFNAASAEEDLCKNKNEMAAALEKQLGKPACHYYWDGEKCTCPTRHISGGPLVSGTSGPHEVGYGVPKSGGSTSGPRSNGHVREGDFHNMQKNTDSVVESNKYKRDIQKATASQMPSS